MRTPPTWRYLLKMDVAQTTRTYSLNLLPNKQNKGKGKGKRQRDKMDDYQRQTLELESRKMEFLKNKSKQKTDEPADENLLFFKSLLTHVKGISHHKILSFCRRFEDLVSITDKFLHILQTITTKPTEMNLLH
ncbi:hypothetical protein RRG08_049862 [Elysia crispata]|uniref:Uncharacterized protein n=1 Tax=Elysia crispata TaxID=231223 RepID=A0AAE0ZUP8_9GAST|nr:hypothetical protein RRG08_049862 [Elysia crispata]